MCDKAKIIFPFAFVCCGCRKQKYGNLRGAIDVNYDRFRYKYLHQIVRKRVFDEYLIVINSNIFISAKNKSVWFIL